MSGTCQPGSLDCDGDGYSTSDGDCNDDNRLVYPNAEELCDSLDNDCDNLVDEGQGGHALSCSFNCPLALYGSVLLEEEFDDPDLYASRWTGTFAAPVVSNGSLVFGPHDMPNDWWNTYSPTVTNDESFGNVMICAHWRVTPGVVGENDHAVHMRGGSEGMVLAVTQRNSTAKLTTKLGQDNWIDHDVKPFLVAGSETQAIEVLLYGDGDTFVGEVKNHSTGEIVRLRTSYSLPASGFIALLGWELENPLEVERVVIGVPSEQVTQILSQP